jgi:hypothetical protein
VKNQWRKKRTKENPYYEIEDARTGFHYYVLNVNSDPRKPYARAFCLVVPQFTGALGDFGDTYCTEIPGLVDAWVKAHEKGEDK